MKLRLAALLLFGVLVLSASAKPKRLADRAPSLCEQGEETLYSCPFARGTGSVCMGGGRLRYRFGNPNKPNFEITSTADWSNVHLGSVSGGGGGHEDHIRFTNRETHYVVFVMDEGSLMDHPGRRRSGIAVVQGVPGKGDKYLDCRAHATIAPNWDGKANGVVSGRQDEGPEYEEPDGPFDIWF